MPLTPEQVRALRPGTWVRLENCDGAYVDGKVLSHRINAACVQWDDGLTSAQEYNSSMWSLCDYHPDYRPLEDEQVSDLSLAIFRLLTDAGISEPATLWRIFLLVREAEASVKADARAIDVLAQSAPEGVSILSLSDPKALHRAIGEAVGETPLKGAK